MQQAEKEVGGLRIERGRRAGRNVGAGWVGAQECEEVGEEGGGGHGVDLEEEEGEEVQRGVLEVCEGHASWSSQLRQTLESQKSTHMQLHSLLDPRRILAGSSQRGRTGGRREHRAPVKAGCCERIRVSAGTPASTLTVIEELDLCARPYCPSIKLEEPSKDADRERASTCFPGRALPRKRSPTAEVRPYYRSLALLSAGAADNSAATTLSDFEGGPAARRGPVSTSCDVQSLLRAPEL